MSYKVLSLKWRPQIFEDIVGQDHITKTLINAFKLDRVAQGYIFTGPRGVGKTTTARILSKALNADEGPRYNFDPFTKLSQEISEGRALDVLEIDGASNRGIEEIRNLREQIKFAPMIGTYKIIIIDEVHMLTNPAFNALLRTLEEPPKHGKFIFCTTDIHKVPATIISRCQKFDFNRISTETIVSRLGYILHEESVKCDLDSLQLIARKADGSMRDALSILDQVISFCGSEITCDGTTQALGIIPVDLYFKYTSALLNGDANELLKSLNMFFSFGVPAAEIVNGLSIHLRNLLYSQIKGGEDLLDMNVDSKDNYISHSSEWNDKDILKSMQLLSDVSSYIRRSDDPKLLLEFTSLKLFEMDSSKNSKASNDKKYHVTSSKLKKKDINKGNEESLDLLVDDSSSKKLSTPKYDDSKNLITGQKKISNDIKKVELKNSVELKEKDDQDLNIKENQFLDESQLYHSIDKVEKRNDLEVSKIELSLISEKWQNFIDSLHIKKPSIASILDSSIPAKFSPPNIIIKIDSTLDFHLNMIEKNRKDINSILGETFGKGISFIVQKENNEVNISSQNILNDEQLNDENDEKVMDKVIDLFDGEILT